jgi:CRISPR/Cas system-associated exonuclease Cas4 (RecB family)
MNDNINSTYDDLLVYLKNNNVTNKKEQKSKPERILEKQVSKESRSIIDEIESTGFIPEKTFSSKGFDVVKFESLMRSRLVDEFKKSQSYEKPYISVSELYDCLRQVYYKRVHYPIDVKAQFRFSYLYLIQRVGDTVHETVQDLYDFVEKEKNVVSEKYKVKGRADGIRDRFLFELKTLDVEKFNNTHRENDYYQGNIYAYILNTEYDYKIDTIVVVYFLRNLKRVIPFDIPVNNSIAEMFLNRSLLLRDAISKRSIIDPIGAKPDHCSFCLFKKFCSKDGFNEIKPPFLKIEEKREQETPKEESPKKKAVFLL